MARIGRIPRLKYALAAVGIVALSLGSWGGALAAGNDIGDPASPLTHVVISADLNCAVNHAGDSAGEFYGDTACGTLVAVGGTLYGPASIPAGGSASPRTAFTPVSQTAASGSGTSGDPWKVTTVVDLGSSGIRLTETDSYVAGDEWYRTDVSLARPQPGEVSTGAIVYRAGDCYLQDSDFGYGVANNATGSVACTADTAPGSRIEEWFPITPGSSYYENSYSAVWAAIGSQAPFPNTVHGGLIDNGAGLSWSVTIPADGSGVTVSHLTAFSPTGQTPDASPTAPAPAPNMSISKSNGAAGPVAPGASVSYTLTLGVAFTGAFNNVMIVDQLPAGIGAATAISDGGVYDAGANTITWGGLSVSNGKTLTYTASVADSAAPGTYVNTASIAQGLCQLTCTATSSVTVGAGTQPGGSVSGVEATPKVTLPPTSTVGSTGDSNGSAGLGLVLLFISGILVLGVVLATPRRGTPRG